MNPIEKRKELISRYKNKNKNKDKSSEIKSFRDIKINISSEFIDYYKESSGGGSSD